MTGRRLGVYEVQGLIGRGGMGEVYRARDTRLGRDVAIKVLPAAFTSDPDRLARFEREARVLASLNHPNIATIHGIEEADGLRGLVMELIPGSTLAERIFSGPLPAAEALPVARQIADALAAAHEAGVVHRDLKPANVKITSGHVKLLDFGLAKLTALDDAGREGADNPTVTFEQTREGQVMGTAAYMSPEQARGKPVDRRTDIWAFGCVLFEMLTGRAAFAGETSSDMIAAVLEREPDWSALPASTPALVKRLLARCLHKDPARRLRDIADAQADLDDRPIAEPPMATRPAQRGIRIPTAAGIALAVGLLAGLAGWTLRQRPEPESRDNTIRLAMPFLGPPLSQPYGTTNLAISPDGARVAFASNTRLWIRRMDQKDPAAIGPPGMDPFFSPDGAWIAVFDSSGLIKIPVEGGPPTLLAATTERPAGGAWRQDGEIVFATNAGLFQVSSDGQHLRLLTAPDRAKRERLYAWPEFLPGGRSILFTVVSTDSEGDAVLAAMDLETLEKKIVLRGASSARYAPPGRLIYQTRAGLTTTAFDAKFVEPRGDAADLQGFDVAVAPDNGATNFAVSNTGTLVYMSSDTASRGADAPRTLQWIDRQGNREKIGVPPGGYAYPRVSPDGTRVALDIFGRNRDIWVLNLERLTLTQLTNGPTEDMTPEWSVDGRRVFFASDRAGDFDVYSQAADGASSPRVELAAPGFQTPQGFTPDGSRLVIYEQFRDLNVFSIGPQPRIERLLHSDAEHRLGRISPDGRWMLYESDESGKQFEIFLRPFPDVGATREKVSINGGRYPRWSPKGSELYYVSLDGDMLAVPVTLSPSLKVGRAIRLFSWRKPPPDRGALPYDVSPIDGRFIVTESESRDESGTGSVSVVLNWRSPAPAAGMTPGR